MTAANARTDFCLRTAGSHSHVHAHGTCATASHCANVLFYSNEKKTKLTINKCGVFSFSLENRTYNTVVVVFLTLSKTKRNRAERWKKNHLNRLLEKKNHIFNGGNSFCVLTYVYSIVRIFFRFHLEFVFLIFVCAYARKVNEL